MSFSAAWLELREPYDLRARNAAVIDAVVAALAGRPSVTIADLACGTGSTFRALRPRIKARQSWRLADNDLSLLARAPQSSPPDTHVTTVPIDLNHDLEAALDGPVDLVTTSALLDLVSDEWLQRLAVETAARRLPVYAALSYDGRIEMTPDDAADKKIIAAVNKHQRTDKGFGPALGPEAAQKAVERFERVGYSVVQGPSDWVFAPTDREIQIEILAGWAAAAREIGDVPLPDVVGWLTRRRDLVAAGRSSIRVGHVDFFARRPARAEPTGRSRTAPRRRAGERCIGVSNASSTRAIGGSEKLARPEPRMIGATMMCSRSRHFAARKRDTVSAPPSISTRRRPRSASAARIAAGAICPSVLAMPTISMSDGNGGFAPAPVTTRRRTPSLASIFAPADSRPRGIDDDPRRLRAGDAPHRELGIVGQRRSDPDHHRIDQGPQPVQVGKPRRPIDVVGMSGFGRNPAVQRLADLRRPPPGRRHGHVAMVRITPPREPAAGRSAPGTLAERGTRNGRDPYPDCLWSGFRARQMPAGGRLSPCGVRPDCEKRDDGTLTCHNSLLPLKTTCINGLGEWLRPSGVLVSGGCVGE